MPSKEALEIAEKYIPDCGGDWGKSMRDGKVNGLARDIDGLRIMDLEKLGGWMTTESDRQSVAQVIYKITNWANRNDSAFL